MEAPVKHSELLKNEVIKTRATSASLEEMTATTIRSSKNLKGASISAYARMCMIDNLVYEE